MVVCTLAAGPARAATTAVVLSPGHVAEAAGQGIAPSDGRLRGQDFTAVVSQVAWPQSVQSTTGVEYVAGNGRRLVTFTVSVTQPTDDSGLLNAPTGVSAALKAGSASLPVSMTRINQEIAGGTSGSAETTGADSFVVSVPTATHSVDLVLTEAGFSQSFDLWTLQRVPPSPTILYRDPNSPTVTGTAASSFNLAFTNPADGFSSSDDAQISSATLTYFAPNGSGTPGNLSQAYMVLGLQSSYPDVPYGQPNSGHFFSSFTPLSGNRLTFAPTGGSPVTGTSSTTAFSSTSAASDDDGIFDALYWFTVPASTTGGTLTVTAGPATGIEYTGFTGTGNAVPIDVTAPAIVSLTFPAAPSSLPAQKTPPWVGAPLPATGASAAPSATGSSSGSDPGLPIGVAVGILAVLAGAVVVVQRVRHRTPATAEAATESIGNGADVELEPSEAPPAPTDPLAATALVPAEKEESNELVPTVNVMGPIEILGLLQRSDRRIVEELLVYLVLHDRRHLRVGQIQIGLRPVGSKRPEISAKTLRNYLYELRRCVGSEHLPEASAREGYLIQGVPCDWVTFQRLARKADAVGGTAAMALRSEALTLVRGKPFEGLPEDAYEWVDEEGLIGQITVAIATCALRLATEHLDAEDYDAVTGAARAGHRGAPYDYGLWEIGARALDAKGDRAALKNWMAEAATKLDAEDVARIWDSLGHRPDSEPS